MLARGVWVRRLAAVAIFAVILFFGYFWPFQIGLDEVRPYLPKPVDDQVRSVIDRLPPSTQKNLMLPLPEVKYQCDFFYRPTPGRGEFNATKWIKNYIAPDAKFVADIFGAELIMGQTMRVSTTGGDWANAPDPKSMMYHTGEIYTTDNASRAYELAKMEKADYVFVPNRDLNPGWWIVQKDVNYTKFGDGRYFEPMFAEDNVTIYRVL